MTSMINLQRSIKRNTGIYLVLIFCLVELSLIILRWLTLCVFCVAAKHLRGQSVTQQPHLTVSADSACDIDDADDELCDTGKY